MNNIKLFFGLAVLSAVIGCSRALVKSDYDREVNFAKYKTFGWTAQPQKSGSEPLEQYTLSEKRIKKAVEKQLTAMGYQKQTTGTPDFLIVYDVTVEDLSDATSNGNGSNGYGSNGYGSRGYGSRGYGSRGYGYGSYGYGFGYGGCAYGGYGYDDYGYEGILILDFIDAKSNELIWRGWYADEVEDGEIGEKKINKAVKHILEKFPPENRSRDTTNLITSK